MTTDSQLWEQCDDEPDVGELLALLIGRPGWHTEAACRKHPELNWFPGRGDDQRAIKKVCASCPVAQQCLDAGLQGHEHGVWGGLNRAERRRMAQPAA